METIETLKNAIDTSVDAMEMAIEMENYAEFFEIYGDIYSKLIDSYSPLHSDLTNSEIYDLIFANLIPRSEELVHAGWII